MTFFRENFRQVFVRASLGAAVFYYFLCLALRFTDWMAFSVLPAENNSWLLHSVLIFGILSSVTFCAGFHTRISALVLLLTFHGSTLLFPILREVHTAYFAAILFVFALYYCGPKAWSPLEAKLGERKRWQLWLLLAVYLGFSVSGFSKLFFAPWKTGELITFFCGLSPLASLLGRGICGILPAKLLGWGVLFIESSSFFLALFPRTRIVTWSLNTLLHLGALFFVNASVVSIGILILQVFLLDEEWLRRDRAK